MMKVSITAILTQSGLWIANNHVNKWSPLIIRKMYAQGGITARMVTPNTGEIEE